MLSLAIETALIWAYMLGVPENNNELRRVTEPRVLLGTTLRLLPWFVTLYAYGYIK